MGRYQQTISKPVRIAGVGLHSGKPSSIELLPAPSHSGIIFQRTDRRFAKPITASVANISNSNLSTSIGRADSKVSTIEHLMAAFVATGIDNALVKVNSSELPILDGSSEPFIDALGKAGKVTQAAFRKIWVVNKPFEVKMGDRSMRIEPSRKREFNITISYDSQAIGHQAMRFVFSRAKFRDLCDARTFCHIDDVNQMRESGLALGGSLENAVVVTDTDVVNGDGLRNSQEFIRHKLLDAVGDLALLGAPLVGRLSMERPGHELHAEFMRQLICQRRQVISQISMAPQAQPQRAIQSGLVAMAAAEALYW